MRRVRGGCFGLKKYCLRLVHGNMRRPKPIGSVRDHRGLEWASGITIIDIIALRGTTVAPWFCFVRGVHNLTQNARYCLANTKPRNNNNLKKKHAPHDIKRRFRLKDFVFRGPKQLDERCVVYSERVNVCDAVSGKTDAKTT